MTHTRINRGDIYYVEHRVQDKKSQVQSFGRPVLIVSNEYATKSNVICGLTLTTQFKAMHMPTHIFGSKEKSGLPRDSVVLCEQPISFDTYLLKEKVGRLDADEMARVDQGLRVQLSL